MTQTQRNLGLFAGVALLFILTGVFQSWNLSLQILNIGILSAIMALGVNMQWGYAGLFSTGIVGSVALGGLAVVLVSARPVPEAFAAGGWMTLGGLAIGVGVIVAATLLYRAMKPGRARGFAVAALLIAGFFLYRAVFDSGVAAVEAYDPATYGNIGGFGLPSLVAWPVGALMAGIAAWVIGKICLGLRSDYLAIATLGIAEIVIVVIKSEDWLARGVKNIIDLPRPWPVPYEVDLQATGQPGLCRICHQLGLEPNHLVNDLGETPLSRHVRRRASGVDLAVGTRAEQPLGPHDARHPRQRSGRFGHGQERDASAPADLHHRLGRGRSCGRHAHLDGRAVGARRLLASALYLPDLGHGHRWRLWQQLGRGSGRALARLALARGGISRPEPHGLCHRRPAAG